MRLLSIFTMIYFLTCCAGGTDVGNGVKTTDMNETKLKTEEQPTETLQPISQPMKPTNESVTSTTSQPKESLTLEKLLLKVFGEHCTDTFRTLQQKGGRWTYDEDVITFELSDTKHIIKLNQKTILETADLPSERCSKESKDGLNHTKIELIEDTMGDYNVFVYDENLLNDEIEIDLDGIRTYTLNHLP